MELRINSKIHQVEAEAGKSLLQILREDLGLTGTKYGCGEGQCGACTVLIDGVPTQSCILPGGHAVGRPIETIEGLERDGKLHPVQQAFLEAEAFQCGYCTSGMVLSAVALLDRNPRPTREEIVSAMNGNVCRCCVYPRIIAAIGRASALAAEGHP